MQRMNLIICARDYKHAAVVFHSGVYHYFAYSIAFVSRMRFTLI